MTTFALAGLLFACGSSKDTAVVDTALTSPTSPTDTDTGAVDTQDTQDTEDTEGPFVPEYAYSELGPYTVGTYEGEGAGSTGETLRIQVWYPSTEAGTPVAYEGLWPGTAYTDVAAECPTPHPVLLFSHGYGGVRWQSAEIVERLVSHGYIVVAPDHPHNGIFDDDPSLFDETLVRRPVDIADSFDFALAESADAASPIAGCIDPEAGYAVSGHSFGGFTAFAVGGALVNDPEGSGTLDISDDRAWAVLPLAPWDAGGGLTDGAAAIELPVMCLSGALDTTTPWSQVTSIYAPLEVEPRHLGEFPLAGHYSFSPVACATGTTGNGCGAGFIDLVEFTELTATSMLAFLESIVTDPAAIEYRPPASDDLIWSDVP